MLKTFTKQMALAVACREERDGEGYVEKLCFKKLNFSISVKNVLEAVILTRAVHTLEEELYGVKGLPL